MSVFEQREQQVKNQYNVVENINIDSTQNQKSVSKDSLLLYPHDNPPYNSVELHYVGREQAKDIKVWKIFTDKNGKERRILINQFFSKNDRQMIVGDVSANVMKENDVIRFHLIGKGNTLDGKAKVEIRFTGAQTGEMVEVSEEFNLVV